MSFPVTHASNPMIKMTLLLIEPSRLGNFIEVLWLHFLWFGEDENTEAPT